MAVLLTAAQMKAVENAAISRGAVTGLGLMEHAGAAVVAAISKRWPRPGKAIVLCGPGNNGGDGYVIARLLAARGWQIKVHVLAKPATADAQAMAALWTGPRASQLEWSDFEDAALCIDAMFGTGLQRDIAPGVWGLLEMALASRCKVVAVDILSGVCTDSGRVRSADYIEWPADLTVTFQAAKLGHVLGLGGSLAGEVEVVSLGLEREVEEVERSDDSVVTRVEVSAASLRKVGRHKYDHGHLVVLAGGPGKGGAGRLAARAGLRAGAGLVTLACPPAALAENAGRLDAVMLRDLAEPADLARLLQDGRINAICLGPGLGLGGREAGLVSAALAACGDRAARQGAKQPLAAVLDADALTLLGRDAVLFGLLTDACVLTPHEGEFARLFPELAARLGRPAESGAAAYSRVDAVRDAARLAGCVVLLKGADTVIAAPDGRCAVNAAVQERAAPWLATAGSGDVLAGVIAGLVARGAPAFDAACRAAWLHAEAARSFGPGLIAEDLPEELHKVFRQMGV